MIRSCLPLATAGVERAAKATAIRVLFMTFDTPVRYWDWRCFSASVSSTNRKGVAAWVWEDCCRWLALASNATRDKKTVLMAGSE
jgi:hypothetical protein